MISFLTEFLNKTKCKELEVYEQWTDSYVHMILICKESGIFRLENHGVPLKLTSQLQEISESLLSLPFEEKQELFAAVNSPLLYFWGTPALNRSGDAFKRGTQASYVNMVEVFNVPLSSLPKLPVSTCDDGAQHSKLEPFR
ncbi:hypothetical protein YC2023_122979 [Brassica napus]